MGRSHVAVAEALAPFFERIRPGDGAIDVGANVGAMTTRLALAVGPEGHVLAIEPQPAAVATCARECRAFPWVTVETVAMFDHQGTVPLFVGSALVHSSCAQANVPTVRETLEVPCDTLDAVATRVPKLAAIKIDAQGSEGQILRGATQLLQRSGLTWMVEIWPAGLAACGSSVADVVRLFADAGWSVLAVGKSLERPGLSWPDFLASVQDWTGHSHTNIVVGRA